MSLKVHDDCDMRSKLSLLNLGAMKASGEKLDYYIEK